MPRREVFAHYFVPYPISRDNKESTTDSYAVDYLRPEGENGAHAYCGGFLRDRPLPRPVSTSPDWVIDDLKTEIRYAMEAGITGFTVDLLYVTPGNYYWEQVLRLMRAAHELRVDAIYFSIVLMPDGSTDATADVNALIGACLDAATGPYGDVLYRIPDGRLVISPFNPEQRGVEFWRDQFLPAMATAGHAVAFVPCLLDYVAQVATYAPFSYGLSYWGDRNPRGVAETPARIADAHNRGKLFMAPVSFQDTRPYASGYQEACNTETLRGSWEYAIAGNCEWVQILTWNDYSENTHIAPSAHIGWGPIDICAYYSAKFRHAGNGPISHDAAFLSHRVQFFEQAPSYPQTSLMQLYQYSTPARNTVELLTLLTSEQTVSLVIGSNTYTYTAPAGVFAKTFPLELGTLSARIGQISVTSPFTVTDTPYVQDLNYYVASSDQHA